MKKIVSLFLVFVMMLSVISVVGVSAADNGATQVGYDEESEYYYTINVLKDPDVTVYEQGFWPDFLGMEIEVIRHSEYGEPDFTSVITVTEDNIVYNSVDEFVYYDIFGEEETLSIFESEEGGFDIICGYNNLNYQGIEFVDELVVVEAWASNVTRTGEGMTVNLVYEDGSVDELYYDVVYLDDPMSDPDLPEGAGGFSVWGCAKTSQGIATYNVAPGMQFGIMKPWYVNTAGMGMGGYSADDIIGDADGDGEMSVLDATEIQMILASVKFWNSPENMTLADVDNDGDISVLDATEIQMILAGLA